MRNPHFIEVKNQEDGIFAKKEGVEEKNKFVTVKELNVAANISDKINNAYIKNKEEIKKQIKEISEIP